MTSPYLSNMTKLAFLQLLECIEVTQKPEVILNRILNAEIEFQ